MTDQPTPPALPMMIERIMEMIPHRYPFLLIDRVIECELGSHALTLKNVTFNEPHFAGHFPAKAVMPGVLIIEAMAQTSAILVVQTMGDKAEGKLVYFMSIDGARFRKPVVPGDTLMIRATKERSRGNVWRFNCTATVDGTLVAEATVAAMILA